MDLSSKIYEGSQPYLFISYAHRDTAAVMPLIRGLMDRGIRVWFDKGVEPVGLWQNHIAEHLVNSHGLIIMLSANALASHNCRREILMAGNHRKNACVVHLEPLKLSPGDEMQLIDYQALYRWKYDNDDAFLSDLCRGSVMEACKSASAPLSVEETVDATAEESIVPTPLAYETIEEPGSAPVPPVSRERPVCTPSAADAYEEALKHYNRRDYRLAVTPARIAAEQDHPGAQYLLGCIYCHSDGYRYGAEPGTTAEQAKEIGRGWIRKAAENGYPQAQRYVGEMEKDPKIAAQWFRKAADRGDVLGLYYLGECYRQGKGVEKNIVKAMDCYLAAHKTHPASLRKYKEVLKNASLAERIALKKAGHSLGRLEK